MDKAHVQPHVLLVPAQLALLALVGITSAPEAANHVLIQTAPPVIQLARFVQFASTLMVSESVTQFV